MDVARWVDLFVPVLHAEIMSTIPDDHICLMHKHAKGAFQFNNEEYTYKVNHEPNTEHHRTFRVTVVHEPSQVAGSVTGRSPPGIAREAATALAHNMEARGLPH
eukprot:TRINITY_DN5345_c0_g1_i2.p1 TRINITY_DN5345_c0_g1~~TRINITY_DN5345_c0_g1_i2.p1  ORF type:complete len:104 (-),score=22.45 TRINITY_DN5345_c0_g1_i2:147-458(-)